MQNMPQNGQKRQKVQKPKKCTNENWPIFIPCDVDDHFWWSKQAINTRKQPYLVGLSENRWKNTKNAISQKGLAKRFWKLVKFMSYMCTLRIKSKQTSYRKVRLDVFWGKCVRVCKVIIKCRLCWILETACWYHDAYILYGESENRDWIDKTGRGWRKNF